MEDRLQKFANLVDAGGFTKGANAMHISQPALSVAIQKLERELRATLVSHDNHHLRLTPAGELAYAAGKEVTAQRDNLKQQITELSKHKIALKLGMIDSIAETLFVHGRELNALEQWAHVSLSINNSSLLIKSVLEHELDVAVIAEQTTMPKVLRTQRLGVEPLVVVARTDVTPRIQAAAKKGALPNFLSYNQTSTTHWLIQTAANAQHITLEPSFYSTSPDIILKLVLAGKGVAALPFLSVEEYCESGVLTPVKLGKSPIIERRIAAITHAQRKLPAAFNDTLSRLQKQLDMQCKEAKRL